MDTILFLETRGKDVDLETAFITPYGASSVLMRITRGGSKMLGRSTFDLHQLIWLILALSQLPTPTGKVRERLYLSKVRPIFQKILISLQGEDSLMDFQEA